LERGSEQRFSEIEQASEEERAPEILFNPQDTEDDGEKEQPLNADSQVGLVFLHADFR
jgi:hypothetical protein